MRKTLLFPFLLLLPKSAYAISPECAGSTGQNVIINTAVGCISTDLGSGAFVKSFTGVLLGLGSGVALVLMLYGVFVITTSQGEPEKIKGGQETITSALIGLLFMVLSLIFLKLIGIDLLNIPGLS